MYFYSKNGQIPLNIKLSFKRYALDVVLFNPEIHKPNKPILLFHIKEFNKIQDYIDYGFEKIIIVSGDLDDECNKKFGYIKKQRFTKNDNFSYKLLANNIFEQVFERLPINNIEAKAHFEDEWVYTGLPTINLLINRNSPIRLLAPIVNTLTKDDNGIRENYLSLFLESEGENKISIPITKLIKIGNSYIQHWNISTAGFESAITVVLETFISIELSTQNKSALPVLLESYKPKNISIICPRLDCDEAISSAELLKNFYKLNNIYLNLAITTNQSFTRVDKKLIYEIEKSGGTISNHSHNHKPYWSLGDPIEKIYQKYLGRKPDEEGYAHYSNKLKRGLQIDEIEKNIKDSDEYKTLNKDPIKKIYIKYFRRKPDEEGYVHYSERLKEGFTVEKLEEIIKASEEFKNIDTDYDFIDDFKKSQEIIHKISTSHSKTCVAPFHQSNQKLVDSLDNSGVELLISGNSYHSPQHMFSIGGQINEVNKIRLHSQQCMLHGESWPNLKEIYFKSFMLSAKRQSIFGYLDHPISPRYNYEWGSKEKQLKAHEDLVKFFKKHFKVESISHEELSKWLKIRSFINLKISDSDEINAFVKINQIKNLNIEDKILHKFRFCQVLYKSIIFQCVINYQ